MENRNTVLNDQSYDDEYEPVAEDKGMFEKKAGGAVEKLLNDTYFAGTKLPGYKNEIRTHISNLMQSGIYTYAQIEDFIVRLNYETKAVRETFKEMTGVSAEDVYSKTLSAFFDAPVTIPMINYGWGKSKTAKYDFCFVMPWDYGYELFGQKGDLNRSEIEFFVSLADAKEALKKNVTEVRDLETKISDMSDIFRAKKKADTSLTEEMEEVTPQQFFDKYKMQVEEDISPEHIAKVLDYIKSTTSKIEGYSVTVEMVKYLKKEPLEEPSKDVEDKSEQMYASAIIQVIFNVDAEELEEQPQKRGLMVFMIVEDNLNTTDTFKGEDDQIYGFSLEGFNSYFTYERDIPQVDM